MFSIEVARTLYTYIFPSNFNAVLLTLITLHGIIVQSPDSPWVSRGLLARGQKLENTLDFSATMIKYCHAAKY